MTPVTNLEEQLLNVVPYNVYDQKFPKRLNNGLRDFLALLQKILHEGKLSSVSTVIVTKMTKDDDQSHSNSHQLPISIKLYVFGTFRRRFAAMKQLAKALAPFYLETLSLPLIEPILSKEWQSQSQKRGQIYTELQTQGILVFSKKAKDNNGT